jgi:threonine dehydratase
MCALSCRSKTPVAEIEKTVVEGAGAAGLAALLLDKARGADHFKGKRVGLVLTRRWCSRRAPP